MKVSKVLYKNNSMLMTSRLYFIVLKLQEGHSPPISLSKRSAANPLIYIILSYRLEKYLKVILFLIYLIIYFPCRVDDTNIICTRDACAHRDNVV